MAGETVEDEVLDEKDDEATEVEEEIVDDDEDDIPVRGAKNAAFARQRIASKEAKKHFEKEETDEELTANAAKLIEKEVDKRVSERISVLELRTEVKDYLLDNPDDKKFEKRAIAYMQAHPTLTVEDAFQLAGKSKTQIDPEAKAKAEKKVAEGSVKGGTVRPKEEKIATTEADFKKIHEMRKSGDPAKRAEAMRLLGIK